MFQMLGPPTSYNEASEIVVTASIDAIEKESEFNNLSHDYKQGAEIEAERLLSEVPPENVGF